VRQADFGTTMQAAEGGNCEKTGKFAEAMSFSATSARGGREFGRVWVGVPVVDKACQECGQKAVNDPSDELVLIGEQDFDAGTLPGGTWCSYCGSTFNKTTCYFCSIQQFMPALFGPLYSH